LYREVVLISVHEISKFCETIISNNALGEEYPLGSMVRKLTLREFYHESDNLKLVEMDQKPLQLMLTQLSHLETLTLVRDEVTRSAYTSFATTPAPSSLTSLRLEFGNYSLFDLILPLFPSLQHLSITINSHDTGLSIDSAPLHPPRQLLTLFVKANYNSQAVCDLIASTESIVTDLSGWDISRALASLRNSEVMTHLYVFEYSEGSDQILDEWLLNLTNLKSLNLGGFEPRVSDHFFTDYFTPELPLQSLSLTGDLDVNFSDLIGAFKTKPSSLKDVVLDALCFESKRHREWDWLDWLDRIDSHDMRRFMDMYESAGVEVSGDDVAILEMVEKEQALLDSDDEGESEDSDDDEE
jgi:hypothetical protein